MSERMFRMRAPNSAEEADVPQSKVDAYRKKGAVVVGVSPSGQENWLANKIDAPTLNPLVEKMHNAMQRDIGVDTRVPYAMARGFAAGAAQGAIDLPVNIVKGAAKSVRELGDLSRSGWNAIAPDSMQVDLINDRPENIAANMPTDSFAGKLGFYGEQAAEYLLPSKWALDAVRAAKLAKATRAGLTGADAVAAASKGWKAPLAATAAADASVAGVQSGGDPEMMALAAAAPPAIGGALRVGGGTLRAVRGAAAGAREGGFGGAVLGALSGVSDAPPTQMIVQATKPRNTKVLYEKNVEAIAPRVKQVAVENGLPLESLEDVLSATTLAKKQARARFEELAGPVSEMPVDLSPLADAEIASIPRTLRLKKPEVYQRLVEEANAFRRAFTHSDAERFLKEANAELDSYYAMFPMGQRKHVLSNPAAAAAAARAETLRNIVYGAIDNHPSLQGLPNLARETNREVGRLMEFEDTLLRRRNVAGRQQPESLTQQMAGVNEAAQTAFGVSRVLHGDLSGAGHIVAGRAGKSVANAIKERNSTDGLLKRAFRQIGPADPYAPIPTRAPARLIERGSIPMGTVADDSYVRGVPAEPARREVAGYLPASTTASRQFEMPPSSEADAMVQGVDADRVVQRDPRTGQMQRVYTGEEAGAARQRAGSPYTPVLSVLPNGAAQAIPDDPDSDWDNYARAGLNLGGVAAMGMAAKGAAKKKASQFEYMDIDKAALARQESFKRGQISFARLPKEARPTFIYNEILNGAGNGISVQPLTGQRVTPGQPGPAMAGVFPNSDKRTMSIPLADFKPRHVEKFVMQNKAVFAKDPHAFIGGWLDKKSGTVYLDVSTGFLTKTGEPNVRAATKFAETQNPGRVGNRMDGKPSNVVRQPDGTWPRAQDAVFDPMSNNPSGEMFPPVGNFYEFINSPEFRDRVVEMAAIGRRAMGGENPEWWNIVNGPMARVYGKQNIEAVAGYLASTSPQNGPEANLKMMTELMRRHIKGEPVRQPNWRAPETAMGKIDKDGNRVFSEEEGRFVSEGFAPSAGQKFPNENTYANNAEKVRAGRANTVTDDKVNDMFHALMGHLVGVFDRHWAKIAEKPSAGIYADKVINRLAGSMDSGRLEAYPVVENRVRDLAKEAGVDISKYSAWVWEGIRKTIRDTGELFGQKHRASAVPETTTGFNELFERLVSAKAKHLGVSVPKLEEMLRNGDAELLALLLSTPIGAAAYSRWRAGGDTTPEGRGPS